jgi:hypothetical protein
MVKVLMSDIKAHLLSLSFRPIATSLEPAKACLSKSLDMRIGCEGDGVPVMLLLSVSLSRANS